MDSDFGLLVTGLGMLSTSAIKGKGLSVLSERIKFFNQFSRKRNLSMP